MENTEEPQVEKPEEKEEEAPASSDLLTNANATAERIEKANADQKALLDRKEQILAQERLHGKADAGQGKPEKKELTSEEYAESMQKGEVNPFAAYKE